MENRLVAAIGLSNTITYAYDPFGRRARKTFNGIERLKYLASDAPVIRLVGQRLDRTVEAHARCLIQITGSDAFWSNEFLSQKVTETSDCAPEHLRQTVTLSPAGEGLSHRPFPLPSSRLVAPGAGAAQAPRSFSIEVPARCGRGGGRALFVLKEKGDSDPPSLQGQSAGPCPRLRLRAAPPRQIPLVPFRDGRRDHGSGGRLPFSKKVENHAYAVALHMMYYNFVRMHSKLRMSPAMAAGVSDRLWEIGDIVKLVEASEPKSGSRGPYKKRSA